MIDIDDVPYGGVVILDNGATVLKTWSDNHPAPLLIGDDRICDYGSAWLLTQNPYVSKALGHLHDIELEIWGWFQNGNDNEVISRFATPEEVERFILRYPLLIDVLSPKTADPTTWWALIGGKL